MCGLRKRRQVMSMNDRFEYGGRQFELRPAWSGSSLIQLWVRCSHHPDRPISLGSTWSKWPWLDRTLRRKVKRGLRTRKRCSECKQDEGMVDRAYAALEPLLEGKERIKS